MAIIGSQDKEIIAGPSGISKRSGAGATFVKRPSIGAAKNIYPRR
jgi:hypothetical protein